MPMKLIMLLIALTVPLYLASGIYAIEAEESAIAFRFGKVVNPAVEPGVHWNLPWPFGRQFVAKTKTNLVTTVERIDPAKASSSSQSLWMTGGASLIQIRLNIQYSIARLDEFVLSHDDPITFMQLAAKKALTRFLASYNVDEILTTERQALRLHVQQQLQSELDAQQTGIQIKDLVLLELTPPKLGRVDRAFQDVQSARSDREREIENARSEKTQITLNAKAEAHQITSAAQSEATARVLLAQAKAERFRGLAEKFRQSPYATQQRLYLEQMSESLATGQLYVIPKKSAAADTLSR